MRLVPGDVVAVDVVWALVRRRPVRLPTVYAARRVVALQRIRSVAAGRQRAVVADVVGLPALGAGGRVRTALAAEVVPAVALRALWNLTPVFKNLHCSHAVCKG